jgi:antitoxin component YwqK of YwqJK toxin-antitoxin module
MPKRYPLLILVFLIFTTLTHAQTKTKFSVKKEYYPNGNLHRVIRTRITTPRYVDPQNYYKRTVLNISEYYENGNIQSRQKKVSKLGRFGCPCYEVLSRKEVFNEQGVIQQSETCDCDRQKVWHREYDDKGNLQYKSVATK